MIVIAYEIRDRAEILQHGHQAKILIADENNRCQKFIQQTLTPEGNNLRFETFLVCSDLLTYK